MGHISLRGLGVAIVTPFLPNKEIDYEALCNLVEHIINGKADYIVVLGTTGETPTLSPEERKQVRDTVRNAVAGRVPLVLGIGGNCTWSLVNEIKETDLTASQLYFQSRRSIINLRRKDYISTLQP